MSRVLTNENNYYDIADTIRQMKNVNTTYKPREMASALKDIYSNEVEGILPLSFEANGNNLLDYRIDGANGGVGDRTGNLFDGECFNNSLDWNTGDIIDSENQYRITTSPIFLSPGNYTIKSYSTDKVGCATYNSNMDFIGILPYVTVLNLTIDQTRYIRILCKNDSVINPILPDKMQIMLNSGSTALPYEPYGYKVPVVVNGKNLLQNNATSQTINGVTFTVNEDGSVTCNTDDNGATADTRFYLLGISGTDFKRIECDTAIKLTGCPSGGSLSTYYISLLRQNDSTYPRYNSYADFGNGFVPSYDATNKYVIYIQIKSGQVCTNLTFYPMIRKADIEDDTYEPYIEPTTTNIYLDEPIEENESISLSDTNTNIPTIDGTNILTIDTTVQPSNVYIQAPKDSDEIIEIINTLEAI